MTAAEFSQLQEDDRIAFGHDTGTVVATSEWTVSVKWDNSGFVTFVSRVDCGHVQTLPRCVAEEIDVPRAQTIMRGWARKLRADAGAMRDAGNQVAGATIDADADQVEAVATLLPGLVLAASEESRRQRLFTQRVAFKDVQREFILLAAKNPWLLSVPSWRRAHDLP